MKFPSIPGCMIIGAAVFLGGCASSPEMAKVAPDTYALSRTDKGGAFDNLATTKSDLVREANEYAAKQGKAAVQVSMKATPMTAPQGFTAVEYQFRVVDKAEVVAKAATPVVESPGNVSPRAKPATPVPAAPSNDLYAQLIKYDDLRKRGILTDAEFNTLKKKLLDSN